MATIKVFDSKGVKELQCFDTLLDVPYIEEEEIAEDEADASDDSVDF